jgi:hypothetical protein
MAANKALKRTILPRAGPPPSLSGLGGPEVPTRVTGSFVYECATQVLILFPFLTIDYG